MKSIAIATICCALAALVFNLLNGSEPQDLSRIDCAKLTVFAPKASSASPKDLCRSYGGLAQTNHIPNTEGLVILVRNQPMGGFDGQHATLQ